MSGSDELKKLADRYFGRGFIQKMIAAGFAARLDSKELSDRYEIPFSVIEENKERYRMELGELEAHSAAAIEIHEHLSKILLASISLEAQENLLTKIRSGKLGEKEMAGLLQFLSKQLAPQKLGDKKAGKRKLSREEFEKRKLRLLGNE